MLKIKVANIPEEGLEYLFSDDGSRLLEILPDKEKIDFTIQRVEINCFARKVGSMIPLQVKAETKVGLECERCLEVVTYPVKMAFACSLTPVGAGIGAEDSANVGEDLNMGSYQDDVIDLAPLVLEQIVLQIPIKPLCREDCKGLCPRCGANLNETTCDCETEAVDQRFAILKKFKVLR